MKFKFAKITLTMIIAAAAALFIGSPAEAVAPAFFACGATKQPPITVVDDAAYIYIDPQSRYVSSSCIGHGGGIVCSWIATEWWNEVFTTGSVHCS